MTEPTQKITERHWPRWRFAPIGKAVAGYPMAISERWMRPISLDEIAAEPHRRKREADITSPSETRPRL
ncbi:hypothetical protein F5X71_18065 [Nocardia brasiliensis]|uniref:Uncharacterized protein n=1 Tax=Nocardia brasiliensis TaxID=37326 RepID=A0A6G9XSS2_NOCBR|nr:hypothetical protein [Nocardia brasiliensis]QIS03974.1 hypothetical protein F5X71_18065 [Nocardia brasiliensis]